MREELLTQMTEGDGDTEFVQLKKRRARKRKRNVKKFEELNDVGSDIPLVHDNAFTGCLPTGCHSFEINSAGHCGKKDDDTGNAQLSSSFPNDGRHRLSGSSLCCHNQSPVSHQDVCGVVDIDNTVKVVNAIGDDNDKTAVHDNALTGCLADGCHSHCASFLPFMKQGFLPSNAQLCESSVDGHRQQLLGIPCDTLVKETALINVQQTLNENEALNVIFAMGSAGMETEVLSRYQKLNRKWRLQQKQSVIKTRIQPKNIRQNQ